MCLHVGSLLLWVFCVCEHIVKIVRRDRSVCARYHPDPSVLKIFVFGFGKREREKTKHDSITARWHTNSDDLYFLLVPKSISRTVWSKAHATNEPTIKTPSVSRTPVPRNGLVSQKSDALQPRKKLRAAPYVLMWWSFKWQFL